MALMTYTVEQLAPGSFDVLLDGTVVASLVRNMHPGGPAASWYAELLDERSPAERPAPFTSQRHIFKSRPKALKWLGIEGRDDTGDADQTHRPIASDR